MIFLFLVIHLMIVLTNLKKNGFLTLTILKEKRKLFLHLPKETKNWFIKDILFLKEIINKFSK
jgi:hypothetical protein